MKEIHVPVAREGYPFILLCGFATLVFAFLEVAIIAVPGLLLTAFVTFFFRDPDRTGPENDRAVVSPADGKVILCEKVTDERFFNGEAVKISIFMNVFNVHVNRLPFAGRVERIVMQPGRFYTADSARGGLHNEYCAMTVSTDHNFTYTVVQVAGLIARRIVCWAERGDVLATGQRYGLIRFGSRLDIYLPPRIETLVKKGDWLKAGQSVIGNIP